MSITLNELLKKHRIEPANDNLVLEFMGRSGAAISTTGKTYFFTKIYEAQRFIDSYYEGLAQYNRKPSGQP